MDTRWRLDPGDGHGQAGTVQSLQRRARTAARGRQALEIDPEPRAGSARRVLLALRRHVESPTKLRPDEWPELLGSIQEARDLLARAFHPDHFNFAFLGNVERHLHLHVLPRYASGRVVIGLTFTDPGYPGHYALVDTGQLADDQLERLATEIRSS